MHWPPRRLWITLLSLATAAFLVRAGWLEPIVGSIVDQAVRNIITLILCFSGCVSLGLWFVRESSHAAWLKRAVWVGTLAAVAVFAACVRIERVSGDLVPEFAWRWSASPDRLLSPEKSPHEPAGTGDAWSETPNDFSRFLGPYGTCSVAQPHLDPDWVSHPPRLIWKRNIGAGWSGFATCGSHAVTLEQRGDEEIVACYAMATGACEWSVAVTARHATVLGGVGPRSTPTVRDGVVYTAGATGWLHAIDGATGKVVWKQHVLRDLGIDEAAHASAVAWGRAGSPLVTADLVIVPGGGPRAEGFVSLVGYDRSTGARRWTAGREQISYCTPALVRLGGEETVAIVNEAHVVAYDQTSGQEVWQFEWPGHSNSDASCSQAVPIGNGQIFVSKGYGIGAAVFEMADQLQTQPVKLRRVWHEPANLKTKFTNVVVHDAHAYGLSDGILECVRLADGRRQWKGGRYGQGQVLGVGNFLLVQAESGAVVLVDTTPEKHRERGRLEAIAGQTWNTLCLAGSQLLVRNAEEAACYELPVLPPTVGSPDKSVELKGQQKSP